MRDEITVRCKASGKKATSGKIIVRKGDEEHVINAVIFTEEHK